MDIGDGSCPDEEDVSADQDLTKAASSLLSLSTCQDLTTMRRGRRGEIIALALLASSPFTWSTVSMTG
jgi:hypothetical protein